MQDRTSDTFLTRHWTTLAVVAIVAALVLVSIVGCKTIDEAKPHLKLGESTQLGTANTAEDAARTAAEAARIAAADAESKRLAKLKANMEGAQRNNVDNPEGPAKEKTANSLGIGLARLEGVQTDQEEAAAEQARAALIDQGKVVEARKARQEAESSARDQAVEIGELRQKVVEAEQREATAIAARKVAEQKVIDLAESHRIEMDELIKKKDRERDEAVAAAENKVMQDQVMWLNRSGAACIGVAVIIGAACMWFGGGLLGIRKAGQFIGIFAFGGLCCFGLAQIVGLWWFKWAILLAVSGVALWIGIWTWRHAKKNDLAEQAQAKAAQFGSVCTAVVPALDKLYDEAEKPFKDWLDEKLFTPLKGIMDSSTRQAVKDVRYETDKSVAMA